MVSDMARLRGCTENGSIQSVNGGFHSKETKSRQSSTPPVRNIFMPPETKTKVIEKEISIVNFHKNVHRFYNI